METKIFKLGHVALYAKGWYKRSDDVWQDLLQILKLDNYTPFNKNDVLGIIVNRFCEDCDVRMSDMLNNICEDNCWKVGYFTDKHTWCKDYMNNPKYDMHTATIYYILSHLRCTESVKIKRVIPKYSKDFKRQSDISLKQVIDMFNNKL
jgi:hypothetical protein